MTNLRDYEGTPIELGSTLQSVNGERGATIDHKYEVTKWHWEDELPEGNDLIANGGFIKVLLTANTAKRFKVVK